MSTGQRKNSRYDFSQIIEYSRIAHSADKVLKGIIQDFSHAGLCMITNHPLADGEEIMIRGILTNDSLYAVVRWTMSMGDSSVKVGVEFKKQDKA
ncbi:MAG: PilZ domain-containing protein [Nitrospirota bacterium]